MYHPEFYRGGISRISYETGKALAAKGHEVYFPTLVPSGKNLPKETPEGMIILPARPGFGLFPRTVAHSLRFLKENAEIVSRVDLIHSHSVATSGVIISKALGLGSNHKKPIVHGQYDTAFSELSAILRENPSKIEAANYIAHFSLVHLYQTINLNHADAIVTEDHETERKMISMSKSLATKIRVVPSGVDTSSFVQIDDILSFKKEAGLPSNAKLIVYVGRIAPRKGLSTLVRSFAHLVSSQNRSDVLLLLVGRLHPSYAESLVRFARELGVGSKMRLIPNVRDSELKGYYSVADALVLPSLSEGIPITLFEAMSVGSPIVISDLPQVRELSPDISNYVLFSQPGSFESLANQISVLLSMKERRNNSDRIRAFALQFDWSNIAERIASVYTMALDGVRI
jgi:glycosyltransferase involved in cell wall biosynthesis